ncbi:aminoacyl-tRNA hydrolase [Pseudalkalibacillus hwajinpoensis]|uniref:aminoacyl-tRNA hydrolase n=1 Tax=Guptibacillus hwajinpoensis TaxID=208199 RepID=UPI001CD51EC6|nr:aminoacyl-tRNA hydrolase [Pseudalkalibacillus hwajinpoensis]MCA0993684.1 aminoacyl-tRNA hydrolase [Pseudalkalibacillus hwajinpoensis]
MKLIVGLGNPGKKFNNTRHNVGFMAIDQLAKEMGIALDQKKFQGVYGKGMVNGEAVYLLKPQTFMNLSGESVRPLMEYFNIEVADLLVIYDDLDLPTGKVRIRQKGSAGGHNGMKSIITHLHTQEFKRVRIGIDRSARQTVIDYVLKPFSKEEEEPIQLAIEQTAKACEAWTTTSFPEVMNQYNS